MEKIVVKDQATADAFKALGIDAIVKGAAPEGDVAVLTSKVDELTKALTEKDAEIEVLKKGVTPEGATAIPAELMTKIDALGTISKGLIGMLSETNTAVADMVKGVNEKLESIEDEVSKIGVEAAPRKSLGGKGGVAIKKAFEVDESTGNKKLSKSVHGKAIVDLFDTLGSDDKVANREMYEDAAMRYESSRQITKAVELDLLNSHGIELVD